MQESPGEFYGYVKTNFPDLIDLAVGFRLHSSVGRGVDYYSDDSEVGFAMIQGKKLSSKTAHLLGIEEDIKSLILAHNFIEAGVDLNLLSSHPDVLDIYRQSVEETNLLDAAICLSGYLEMKVGVVNSDRRVC